MKANVEDIGSLLALKRYELPSEGCLEGLLDEFHARRREESLGRFGWWSRCRDWFAPVATSRWAYGAGVAYAAAVLAFVVTPKDAEQVAIPAEAASYQPLLIEQPVAVEEEQPVIEEALDEPMRGVWQF